MHVRCNDIYQKQYFITLKEHVLFYYIYLISHIKYMFFCRVMKYCLDLSVQLTYQDCFKCFGKELRAHTIFVYSNLEFRFSCVSEKQFSAWYAPGEASFFFDTP